jgi:amidase
VAATAEELLFSPATELAELVRSGQTTSRELVESALARIERLNPEINAFTTLDAERALATADGIGPGDERPFAGVPIAIKDLFTPVDGIPMSNGCDFLGDYTPDYDNSLVRRVKEAGFVIVGVTASPEFGIPPVTESRRWGPTRNPWDTTRTPGGSSGGSGAAVAAGMVPIGHASDGGGSIRIPAACNGLVGLKPSRGRISLAPVLGDHVLATDGAVTRNVADAAAILDVMAGYELGDSTWAPPPSAPFAEAVKRDPGKLRIAVTTTPPLDYAVAPECVAATMKTAELLESLGHQVEEATPVYAPADSFRIFTTLWAAGVGSSVMFGALMAGREPTEDDVEKLTWWLYTIAKETPAIELEIARGQLQGIARTIVQFWADYDVLLTPGLGEKQVEIGEIDTMSDNPAATFARCGAFTPFTPIFNVTGQPAVMLPLHQWDDGLPMAVQLVGPPAGEELLLSLSAQIETAAPWADRRPQL